MHSRRMAYLQLIRLPTMFTPIADIILGFVASMPIQFKQAFEEKFPNGQFWELVIASCCLYLSGMVLNDVFDRKQDAAERPGRPIPSGRITLLEATTLGICLMLAGVITAACVSWGSLQIALMLSLAILGYDSFLKRTWVGPVAMGSCRFLNVLLGGSAYSQDASSIFSPPLVVIAAGLGIYIVGVTIFARTEARVSSRWQLGLALLVLNAGIVVLAMVMLKWQFQSDGFAEEISSSSSVPLAMGILLAILFTINRRCMFALYDPKPLTVQTGIKVMLLSYVMLDATMVYWYLNGISSGNYGTMVAMATAALVLPSMFISRFIPMT